MQNYSLRFLLGDLKNTAFVPYEVVIKARDLAEFPDWDRHESEDFFFMLSGSMTLFTELYEPVVLQAGDSVYYDARMGHACISLGSEPARALCVTAPIGRNSHHVGRTVSLLKRERSEPHPELG